MLLLTFSTQARTQLEREAARQLTAKLRRKVEITNYHRFFWQQVLAYRRAMGLPMRIEIGSRRQRVAALKRACPKLTEELERSEGLIESLAEHSFPEFQDDRTPSEADLRPLLAVVEAEQRAGRLVFDDLGALFWSLLERFPSVACAYMARYRVVIADEHQDASALQDAVVRRLGRHRLIVFADPMQLIHEFRGASSGRLEYHRRSCDEALELRTPHRWHGSQQLARWLLAVRARLQGHTVPGPPPPQLRIERTRADHGFNGMKPAVKKAVSRGFQEGCRTVAVLARGNTAVSELRTYLSRQGQYPRQIGTQDFEDARTDIEQLQVLTSSLAIAMHAIDRLEGLVPTLNRLVLQQVRQRISSDGVNMTRVGSEAGEILTALRPIFSTGPSAYFTALATALEACSRRGHHLPRVEAVQSIRATAKLVKLDATDLESVLDEYGSNVLAAAHAAPRIDQGLFVMTAHQAKGKEFDAIVLADATERFWPDDAESRRLFYVVITRASKSWTVVAPNYRASPLLHYISDT